VNPKHLFLGTRQVNIVDMVVKGRAPRAKLHVDQVLEIRRLVASGRSQMQVAKTVGVSHGQVSKIVNRQRWKHL
jgi:hypothetical protein